MSAACYYGCPVGCGDHAAVDRCASGKDGQLDNRAFSSISPGSLRPKLLHLMTIHYKFSPELGL